MREEQLLREMILEGVVSILEGMNPRMLENTLQAFLAGNPPHEVKAAPEAHV